MVNSLEPPPTATAAGIAHPQPVPITVRARSEQVAARAAEPGEKRLRATGLPAAAGAPAAAPHDLWCKRSKEPSWTLLPPGQ
jgi:hypothetical protein